jgi:hypothetical protein
MVLSEFVQQCSEILAKRSVLGTSVSASVIHAWSFQCGAQAEFGF